MSCAGCANNTGGSPRGCKNNGTCSSGGCNKLEVFDWLGNMELPAGKSPFGVVEVRFKNGRKAFYNNLKNIPLNAGETVVVEGAPGFDIGIVSLKGELVKMQMARKNVNIKPRDLRKIYRKPSEEDLENWKAARDKEYETMHEARKLAIKLNLQMKISDVEFQGDGKKAIFYYTAESRVDFRELIKVMADQFKVRIEMKQIGSRQEAGRLGGIGSCGRELCCSTWLTDFRSVSTSSARYQQLALNPQKLAGQCGKLKCCLNYELDMYIEAYKAFPKTNIKLKTKKGDASHTKTDIFKKLMYYYMPAEKGGGQIIPLEVDRVKEIIALNKAGKIPGNLNDFMLVEETTIEPKYDNVVGQDELTRFDSKFKKKKSKRKPNSKRNNQKKKNFANSDNKQNKPKQQGNKSKKRSFKKKPDNK